MDIGVGENGTPRPVPVGTCPEDFGTVETHFKSSQVLGPTPFRVVEVKMAGDRL